MAKVSWRARVPIVVALLLGGFALKGGFGLYASDRTLVVRLPVSYADVRGVEVQIWKGDGLLKREQSMFPKGLTNELQVVLPLERGPHRAIISAELANAKTESWVKDFDPQSEKTLVLDLK